ncbi:hypothetical protein D3C86_1044410 [compost metagenome]
MFNHYKLTHLEQFIEDLYTAHEIFHPDQITITELSDKLNVWIHYENLKSRAYESASGMHSMFLDKHLSPDRQRLDFLHELCHLLRHAGNQTILPELFTKAQEAEADQFVLYATMPYSMLSKLCLPYLRVDAIQYIATLFQVPISLAEQRYDQILRRKFEGDLSRSIRNQNETTLLLENDCDSYIEVMPQTCNVFAYYDPSGELDGPSQLVVCISSQQSFPDQEVYICIDEPFDRLNDEDPSFLSGVPVIARDLRISNGQIILMLYRIAQTYGRSANRFVIQMKDINSLVEFEKF